MQRLKQVNWILIAGVLICLGTWAVLISYARADDFADRFSGKIQCPDPGVKCKVLFLTEQEERMLMGQNGILDTAAQARALDLGQFAVYLKTRIGSAAQGEVKSIPSPATPTPPAENKPTEPVDSK